MAKSSKSDEFDDVVLTLDADWAPAFVVDFVRARLESAGVASTWFVTDDGEGMAMLRGRPDLHELGIHPNFLPKSTHGDSPEDVLDHCLSLVPEARSMRTHGLVQSTQILDLVARASVIERDVSIFIPYAPFPLDSFAYSWQARPLIRIPYCWDDAFELGQVTPVLSLDGVRRCSRGLRVLNFHPIHVYLNSGDFDTYARLKRAMPSLDRATPEDLAPFVGDGRGVRTLFDELLAVLSANGGGRRVQDLASSPTR